MKTHSALEAVLRVLDLFNAKTTCSGLAVSLLVATGSCTPETPHHKGTGGSATGTGGEQSSAGGVVSGGAPARGGAPSSSGGKATTGGASSNASGGSNSSGATGASAGEGGASQEGGAGFGDAGDTSAGGVAGGDASAGGSAAGGIATGGTAAGGAAQGGVAQAGTAAGGTAAGGTSSGGTAAGGTGSGGAASGGSGGSVPVGPSDLPVPPGAANLPQPSGTASGFKILNWAAFKGAVSFTFDDVLQSQIDHYADFKATGVRMTFYLVCSADGSNPAWKQMALDGQELGNHTLHHCYADGTACWGPFTGTSNELDECTTHIKSAFGVNDVYTMAAPMGDQNWSAPASTRFLVNRGVQDMPSGIAPNDNTSPFDLPCHTASEGETAAGGFNPVIDSTRSGGIWRIILNHSVGNKDGYNPVAASEVIAAMNYAKGLGNVWTDTVVNVAAYWRGQKLVSQTTPSTSGSAKTWSWTLPAHFPPGRYLRATVDGGTLTQNGVPLAWDGHGYYEVALDAGSVTLTP